MYKKVDTNMNFVDREKETVKFWKENGIFEKSIELRLANARGEMDYASRYDARVVNDDLDQAATELLATFESFESN